MAPVVGKLTSRIEVPVGRDEVFAFFADAANLGVITPPELSFRIRTPLPIEMGQGTLIDYTIGLWGIPMRWRTLITRWDPPYSFVDEQLRGPYRTWVHTHRFLSVPGGTVMEDDVEYSLHFGVLAAAVAPIVRRQVEGIFRYRDRMVRERFSAPAATGAVRANRPSVSSTAFAARTSTE